jgi:transcriptional regulator with XRE-family HTH domain
LSDKDFNRRLGKIIRAARQLFGLSQLQLARKIGVPQSRVSRWEKAKVAPSAFEWFELCKALGISTDSLLWAGKHFDRPLSRFGRISRTIEEEQYHGLDVSNTDLSGLSLMSGDFTRSILTNCDLSDAYLPFARFHEANLNGADLSRATLSSADFRGFERDTDLRNAQFTDADLRGALINERTLLPFSSKIASARGLVIVEPLIEEIIMRQACGNEQKAIIRALEDEARIEADTLEDLEEAADLTFTIPILRLNQQTQPTTSAKL